MALLTVLSVVATIVTAILLFKIYQFVTRASFFDMPEKITVKPLETVKEKRKAVLKRRFRLEDVPDDLDAIIVGSGMGGLTCAGLLARAGKKVRG